MFVTTYHIRAQVVLFYRISGTDSFQLIWKNNKGKGKDPEGGIHGKQGKPCLKCGRDQKPLSRAQETEGDLY